MFTSVLNAKALQNEAAAYAWVEARVWPKGPICPHCGGMDRIGSCRAEHPPRPLQVLPVPQAIHRQGRHRFRRQPCLRWPLAAGDVPAVLLQEGH